MHFQLSFGHRIYFTKITLKNIVCYFINRFAELLHCYSLVFIKLRSFKYLFDCVLDVSTVLCLISVAKILPKIVVIFPHNFINGDLVNDINGSPLCPITIIFNP